MAQEFKEHGYDREEEYFHKKNKELMNEMRTKLDHERKNREALGLKKDHWMKCPKCGSTMQEIDLQGVKIDKCVDCYGIYFDKGELELLLDSQEQKGFFNSLKRIFGKE